MPYFPHIIIGRKPVTSRNRTLIVLLIAAASVATWFAAARAEAPAAYCQHVNTDDTTRPIPEILVPAINAAFGTQMPPRVAMDNTVFRCADRHVLVCTVGANLPCGKADTSGNPSEGALRWCADNPNASSVPAFATGHDTIYQWRCADRSPQIARQILHVDSRGFVVEFWKRLP